MSGLLGERIVHTGRGDSSCSAMRDGKVGQSDGAVDVQHGESEESMPRMPRSRSSDVVFPQQGRTAKEYGREEQEVY